MGRKKKKIVKPWCWYCNRDFEDEKILIQHQKAKHFKCHVCYKKLFTGPGLAIHCQTVHKETIDKIPNSLPNRGSTELEIYGMEGIPDADIKKHEAEILGKSVDDEPPDKKTKGNFPIGMMHPGMLAMMGPIGARPPMMPGGVSMPMAHGIPPIRFAPMMPGMPLPPMMPPVPPIPPVPPALVPSARNATSAPSISGPLASPSPKKQPQAPTVAVTFPAYSNPAVVPNQRLVTPNAVILHTSYAKPTNIVQPATGTKIMHPDEDISLEERRASFPKYSIRTSKMQRGIAPGSMKPSLTPAPLSSKESLPNQGYPTAAAPVFGFHPMTMSGMPNYGYPPNQAGFRPGFMQKPGGSQAAPVSRYN